jgi:hypothetical protein
MEGRISTELVAFPGRNWLIPIPQSHEEEGLMFRANAPAVAVSLPAITSTGAIVQIEAKVFLDILARGDRPLVVEYHKK